jgi:hypothetical protein
MRPMTLAFAAALILAAPGFAQTGYSPPNEEVECKDGTRKLETGLEVIAPGPRKNHDAARAALQRAKNELQAGKWYACSVAAESGLRALDAG